MTLYLNTHFFKTNKPQVFFYMLYVATSCQLKYYTRKWQHGSCSTATTQSNTPKAKFHRQSKKQGNSYILWRN